MSSSTKSTSINPKPAATAIELHSVNLEASANGAAANPEKLARPVAGATEVLSTDQSVRSRMDFGTQVPERSVSRENDRLLAKLPNSAVFSEKLSIDAKLEISATNWKSLVNEYSDIFAKDFRDTLIARFNELSKSADWENDDIPVTDASAKTSLELLANLNPTNPPYIGCDYNGNVRFDWGDIDVCARFSCLPELVVKWYASYKRGGKRIMLGEKEKISEFIANEEHKDIICKILGGEIINPDEYLDLEECAQNGSSTTGATCFRVRIDNEYVYVDGDSVSGRQLLDLANRKEEQQESIYLKRMQDGLEKIDIYRPIDLTEEGIESFVTLDTSATYNYKLNGEDRVWYKNLISGMVLKQKAGVDPYTHNVIKKTLDEFSQIIQNNRYTELSLEVTIEFTTTPMETVSG